MMCRTTIWCRCHRNHMRRENKTGYLYSQVGFRTTDKRRWSVRSHHMCLAGWYDSTALCGSKLTCLSVFRLDAETERRRKQRARRGGGYGILANYAIQDSPIQKPLLKTKAQATHDVRPSPFAVKALTRTLCRHLNKKRALLLFTLPIAPDADLCPPLSGELTISVSTNIQPDTFKDFKIIVQWTAQMDFIKIIISLRCFVPHIANSH